MDCARNIQVDLTVMKEPRGFLRVIQFVLSIFAFATLCTSATAYINVRCGGNGSFVNEKIAITYSYPFDLSSVPVKTPFCGKTTKDGFPLHTINFAAAAQFFCFIAVMSFLLCIAYCVGYVVFSPLFVNDSRASTADFVFSAVWAVLWFIASAAWADKLNSMGFYLDPQKIITDELQTVDYCIDKSTNLPRCKPGEAGSHATLIVSVLFGFLNMLVWGAGLWFLYKETSWHKERAGDIERFDQPQGEPTPVPGSAASYQSPDPDPNTTPTY